MKKLLSLVLAAMLCLCALMPAVAETAVETFPYTMQTYRMYFDVLAANLLQVQPQWEMDATGAKYIVTVGNYGVVEVEVDAQGGVIALTTVSEFSMSNGELQEKSNNFGMVCALVALTSKAAEDINGFTEDKINSVTQELVGMIQELSTGFDKMDGTPYIIEREVDGNLCAFMAMINTQKLTLTFGFTMKP
ncbi:MAG: hypothetical protein IKL25_07995 [Clostridia bacterium]|nr:hypothetical protein [Clostridia bacterium]